MNRSNRRKRTPLAAVAQAAGVAVPLGERERRERAVSADSVGSVGGGGGGGGGEAAGEGRGRALLSDAELARYLRSVRLQADVVRFLGAPALRKRVSEAERALSLFGAARQRAELCELLLVVGNFELAFAIQQAFRLPAVRVYTNAVHRLVRAGLVGRVNDLLKDIRLMGVDERAFGDVVMAVVEAYAVELQRPETAEKFVAKLSDARQLVRANALVGNYKQAYIGAARLDSLDDVHMVRNMASKAGAAQVVALCEKYIVEKVQAKDRERAARSASSGANE